jgi:ABC-type multidrug transport system ATPase subunit
VLLSTHNLHEAEELCSGIAIIDSGSLVITGRPGEMGADGGRYLVRCDADQLLFRGRCIIPEQDGHVLLESDDPPADLLAELVSAGNRITEFRPMKRSLSDVFIHLTGGEE